MSSNSTVTSSTYILQSDNEDSGQSRYEPKRGSRAKYVKVSKNKRENSNSNKDGFNSSVWTLEENILYKEFLEQNVRLFNRTRQERRQMKINVLISKKVKTRSSDQCRSHHQKMSKIYGNIQGIIAQIEWLQEKRQGLTAQEDQEQELMKPEYSPAVQLQEVNQIPCVSLTLWDSLLF